MAGHTFLVKPGAFVAPLSESARQQIAKYHPTIPLQAVENAASFYLLRREILAGQPDGKELQKQFDSLAKQLDGLVEALQPIQQSNLRKLINDACAVHGEPDAVGSFTMSLARFRHCLKAAVVPRGRAMPARDFLVSELAQIVADKEHGVDATPQGKLCLLTQIVLESTGEATDVPKLVRRVLRQRNLTGQN